jgi:hypothetical protein
MTGMSSLWSWARFITSQPLPSWQPHPRIVPITNRRRKDSFTSSQVSAHVKLVAQGKIVLRGTLLGSCGRFSVPNDSKYAYGADVFIGWKNLVADKLSLLYANSISTTCCDAYWQTLCASTISLIVSSDSLVTDVRTSNDSIQRSWHDSWWTFYQKSHTNLGGEHEMESEVKKNAKEESLNISLYARQY